MPDGGFGSMHNERLESMSSPAAPVINTTTAFFPIVC